MPARSQSQPRSHRRGDTARRTTRDITRRTALERAAATLAVGALAATASAHPALAATTGTDTGTGTGVRAGSPALPASVAGVRVPDTRLARATAAFVHEASSPALFRHVLRTYLFGALLLDRRGVRYDRELAFVAAALHDLGLVEAYRTPAGRFEVDGADAARRFLRGRRVPAARVAVVWDAIALHTNAGIATRKSPEIALVSLGSGLDFTGNGLDEIPPDALADVLTAFPREGFTQEALDTILSLCRTKPLSVLLHPFAEVGRRHLPGFPVPTLEDLLLAAPFAD